MCLFEIKPVRFQRGCTCEGDKSLIGFNAAACARRYPPCHSLPLPSCAPFPSSCSLSPRATSPTLLQPSPSSKSRPPQVPKSHGLQCFFPKLVRTTHTQNKFGQNALVAVGIMSTHAQNDNVNKCKRKRDKHPGKFETTWSTTTRQVFLGKITRITFER